MTDPVWRLAFHLIPIVLPYTVFICLVGIMTSCCNCFRTYFLPSLTAVFQNVILIGALYWICPKYSGQEQLEVLAWSVLAAGVVELAFMLFLLYRMRLLPVFSRETLAGCAVIRNVLSKASYGILGMSALQLSMLCDRVIASWISSYAPAALYNSDRLIYLPVGIFAVAFGTVSLTEMSHMAAGGRVADMMDTLMYAFRNLLFITIPLAVYMMLFGMPLIRMFFYHGAFNETALHTTASAFIFYTMGIPAFACLKISVAGFYAVQDMKTPLKVSVGCILLNLVLNLLLMKPMKQDGIALATVVASYLNNGILLYLLHRKFGAVPFRKIGVYILKLLGICIVPCGVAYMAYRIGAPVFFSVTEGFLDGSREYSSAIGKMISFIIQAVPLGLASAVFGGIFLCAGIWCRIPETEIIREKMKRIFGMNKTFNPKTGG